METNLMQSFKFLEDLFDKTVIELRYKSCANRLTKKDKNDLINIIDKSISNFENNERISNFENNERISNFKKNKKYAFYIKGYYFNPEIDYSMEGAYLEANKLLAKQINKDVIKVINCRMDSIGALRWLYRCSIRDKINKIFVKYNPSLGKMPENRNKNYKITLPPPIRKMRHRYRKKVYI